MKPFFQARHIIFAFAVMAIFMILAQPTRTQGGQRAPLELHVDLGR